MHARVAQNVTRWNGIMTWIDNDKIDGEGQVCNGKTSGVESTAADRTHMEIPTATAPATTETTTIERHQAA